MIEEIRGERVNGKALGEILEKCVIYSASWEQTLALFISAADCLACSICLTHVCETKFSS